MNNSNPTPANLARQLPIESVDRIVDQLMDDIGAEPRFRPWYCAVVYEFGMQQVYYWQIRVKGSTCPAKLFSRLVTQQRARGELNYRSIHKAQADAETEAFKYYGIET